MANRIEERFEQLRQKGEKGLITYIAAGDPNTETTEKMVLAMEEAGADIVELGIPYSDPLADGPVIQEASQRALKGGITLKKIFQTVANVRQHSQVPLALMTYVNPILQYGVEAFVAKCEEVGVDGLIIPDLPQEETYLIRPALAGSSVALIPLLAPTSTEDRIREITREARGFVYCVSVIGVTGIRQEVSADIDGFISTIRKYTDKPLGLGFGISTPEQAKAMARLSDAVIVGSAIVKIIGEKGASEEGIEAVKVFTAQLKTALKDDGN
ncbi:MAG: tryptophan synthase subunit alpha [Thermincolia bacterium]